MDGNLLKELPDCHSENADLCDIDPSKLLLEHVSKLFHGNYSCQAANEAGWSPMSEPQQLEIYCEYMRELLLLESQVYETGKYASGPPINSHNPPRKTRNTSKRTTGNSGSSSSSTNEIAIARIATKGIKKRPNGRRLAWDAKEVKLLKCLRVSKYKLH